MSFAGELIIEWSWPWQRFLASAIKYFGRIEWVAMSRCLLKRIMMKFEPLPAVKCRETKKNLFISNAICNFGTYISISEMCKHRKKYLWICFTHAQTQSRPVWARLFGSTFARIRTRSVCTFFFYCSFAIFSPWTFLNRRLNLENESRICRRSMCLCGVCVCVVHNWTGALRTLTLTNARIFVFVFDVVSHTRENV